MEDNVIKLKQNNFIEESLKNTNDIDLLFHAFTISSKRLFTEVYGKEANNLKKRVYEELLSVGITHLTYWHSDNKLIKCVYFNFEPETKDNSYLTVESPYKKDRGVFHSKRDIPDNIIEIIIKYKDFDDICIRNGEILIKPNTALLEEEGVN
jgi:hypothetical protein